MSDVDPEVERLARVYMATWAPAKRLDIDPGELAAADDDHVAAVAAVLANLRERYVLVPREGTSTRWEPRWVGPNGGILPASKGGMEQRRRVVYCPWEPADAPLSAQNGPDDSQGHPDRDDA